MRFKRQVLRELKWDSRIAWSEIGVEVLEGVVTLTGMVNSYAKKRAGWKRPILFRGGVGGHACVSQVARDARKYKVKRLLFAHIGRHTIRAIDAGERPVLWRVCCGR